MANFRLSRKICICIVIFLIFSNSVFAVSISSSVNAQASYTRIGQFNQYITNNYGSQTANADTSLLIGMYQSLAKLAAPGVAYGIDRVNHTYYLTGQLTYLQEYLQQITENQYDIYKSEDTYLNGLSSVVSDIKVNTQNTAAATNAALTLNNDYVRQICDELGSSTYKIFDQNLDQYSVFTSNCSYQFLDNGKTIKLYNFNGTTPAYIGFANMTLNQKSYYVGTLDIKTNTAINLSVLANGQLMYSQNIPVLSNYSKFVSYREPVPQNSFTGGIYIINGNVDSSTEIYIQNFRYYLDLNLEYLTKINNSLQDLEVNVEVNDSINVTPIDLDVNIGIDDFTAVNTVSNKLRTWLTTGVSVSALIGALDDLDDSFFTLSNRNTIETINNQYTDFYD